MRDYNQRTSPLHDDRDADTVTSLTIPIIKTCDAAAPNYVFFLVSSQNEETIEEGKIPQIDMVVQGYVKMSALPRDLVQSIRQALQGT